MWKRTLLSLPVALLTLTLLGGAEGIDPDELACEQGVKKLLECCPTESPATQLSCWADRGCGHNRPDLSSSEGLSIAQSSCEEILNDGACNHPHIQQPPSGIELPE